MPPKSKRQTGTPAKRNRGGPSTSAPPIDGPLINEEFITRTHPYLGDPKLISHPKDTLARYWNRMHGGSPTYRSSNVSHKGQIYYRAHVQGGNESNPIIGVADAVQRKEAERLAALSLLLQLSQTGQLEQVMSSSFSPEPELPTLSDGTKLTFDRAKLFMEYYSLKFNFPSPDVVTRETRGQWEAVLTVGGRRIGIGTGLNKKLAIANCYLDVVPYLDSSDPELWPTFLKETKGKGDALGFAPPIWLNVSPKLATRVKDLCDEIQHSDLYSKRPDVESSSSSSSSSSPSSVPSLLSSLPGPSDPLSNNSNFHSQKSHKMLEAQKAYYSDPSLQKIRAQREALPIFTRAQELIQVIGSQDVTICMAATGSGKTTQIPQIILDDYISRGEGSRCNIICTQPRRIAAISVAQRVANERGETLGKSIGYQVRFDSKLPLMHGSVTFCTTGIFLKRMQSALNVTEVVDGRNLDDVTHIVIDEVHERDVDTDLTLAVLKRLMEDRRARKKPLKIILMSATIDPTLFQTYFADAQGNKARTIDIPGRSFPVEKHYLEDIIQDISKENVVRNSGWVLSEKNVVDYLTKEVGPLALTQLRGLGAPSTVRSQAMTNDNSGEDLEIPFAFVALTVAHVLRKSDSGHVLVFLPGWEEIMAVQRMLLDNRRSLLGVNFSDASQYSVHLLHSTIPVSEQQAVFEPAAPGVRRIILATNIAETSITIPDVVYVVDTGKVKEKRYDPERHMSSLVSAWVGSSNLNQRAGRAGRHRPGQYYGIISRPRLESLDPYQMVEMKRVDLSNVVMHVKALDFPGMEVEEIFASLIEPPARERVDAALETLKMVGALDHAQRLTSLGRVLLQVPIDAAIGRLVLYGCLFKCLDAALTLAAVLTNREPFVAPMALKQEANAAKWSWSPKDYRSDPLAAVYAYNAWWDIQSRGDYHSANSFCSANFLSKPSVLIIQKIKSALLQSLVQAGVVEVSAGGAASLQNNTYGRTRDLQIPPELNVNAHSLPVLASLIAIGSQPNFATRTSDKIFRTSQDKNTFIHPSSVNTSIKRESSSSFTSGPFEKQLISFAEKARNVSAGQSSGAQTFLRNTTRLDEMTYLLFGAYNVEVVDRGLECDDWLPIQGNTTHLSYLHKLKSLLDSCMLRVFEGISTANAQRRQARIMRNMSASIKTSVIDEDKNDEDDHDDDDEVDETRSASPLSRSEITELDYLTRDVVAILEMYQEERTSQSRRPSRPTTPFSVRPSPSSRNVSLPPVSGSAFSEGVKQLLRKGSDASAGRGGRSTFSSRPQTPLREMHSRP